MYVLRLPFIDCPWERTSNWAWGRDPQGVQFPNPAGTIGSASHTLTHSRALALSVANFNLGS